MLSYAKPGNRCPSVTIDPNTGAMAKKGDPTNALEVLKGYRQLPLSDRKRRSKLGNSPLFAMHFGVVETGRVSVGDEVFVAE